MELGKSLDDLIKDDKSKGKPTGNTGGVHNKNRKMKGAKGQGPKGFKQQKQAPKKSPKVHTNKQNPRPNQNTGGKFSERQSTMIKDLQ